MAGSAKSLQVLRSLATASSLSPFALQLQALQQLSEFCTSQYTSVPAPPTEIPSQQLAQSHCAATSNGLQQLTLLLQQWRTTPSSDSTQGDDSTSGTTATPADPSSSDPAASQVPPQLSQDALQAVLLLTDAANHTIDAMRQAVTLKVHCSAIGVPGRFAGVPDLQEFVGSIVSSGENGRRGSLLACCLPAALWLHGYALLCVCLHSLPVAAVLPLLSRPHQIPQASSPPSAKHVTPCQPPSRATHTSSQHQAWPSSGSAHCTSCTALQQPSSTCSSNWPLPGPEMMRWTSRWTTPACSIRPSAQSCSPQCGCAWPCCRWSALPQQHHLQQQALLCLPLHQQQHQHLHQHQQHPRQQHQQSQQQRCPP